jgi:hypothetical protein
MKHRKGHRISAAGVFGRMIELQEKAVDFLVCVVPWLGVMLWLAAIAFIVFGFVPKMILAFWQHTS